MQKALASALLSSIAVGRPFTNIPTSKLRCVAAASFLLPKCTNISPQGVRIRTLATMRSDPQTDILNCTSDEQGLQNTAMPKNNNVEIDGVAAVADAVTIILTTSATISNPSTWLLEHVMSSLVENEPSLTNARKIIVCDGAISVDTSSAKVKFKSGRISPEQAVKYEEYKDCVDKLVLNTSDKPAFRNTVSLRLTKRHGFAFAVREALESVTTPLVMVVQHDRYLCRTFGMEKLVSFMVEEEAAASKGVEYVCLKGRATSNYANYVRSRYQMDIIPFARTFSTEDDLLPLLFWYDSTHVARASYYRNFVFGFIRGARGKFRLRTGDFIEDKLGQCQLNTIKAQGMGEHARFGTFLLDDGVDMPIVQHASGRMQEGEIVKKVSESTGWGGTVSEHPAVWVNAAATNDDDADGNDSSTSGSVSGREKYEYSYKTDKRNKPHTPSLKLYLANMAVRGR